MSKKTQTPKGTSPKVSLTIATVTTQLFEQGFGALYRQPGISLAEKFALIQSRKDIMEAVQSYETARQELVKKHGKAQADGGTKVITDSKDPAYSKETYEAFFNELKELQAVEFPIYLTEKVKLSPNSTLTAQEIDGVQQLVDME